MSFRALVSILMILVTLSPAVAQQKEQLEGGVEAETAASPSPSAEALPQEAEAADVAPSPSATPAPSPAAPAATDDTAARRERIQALSRPVSFTSTGHIRAWKVTLDRDLHYTFAPIREKGVIHAVTATIVDRAHGNKITKGRLEITQSGALRTRDPRFVNVSNVGSIDPATRAKLQKVKGPVETNGQIEISETVHAIHVVHRRVGEVADDGSMRIESQIVSTDEKVKVVTITTLAPDGLPWLAETTGTIAKGPVNLNVSLRLEREMTAEEATRATDE